MVHTVGDGWVLASRHRGCRCFVWIALASQRREPTAPPRVAQAVAVLTGWDVAVHGWDEPGHGCAGGLEFGPGRDGGCGRGGGFQAIGGVVRLGLLAGASGCASTPRLSYAPGALVHLDEHLMHQREDHLCVLVSDRLREVAVRHIIA